MGSGGGGRGRDLGGVGWVVLTLEGRWWKAGGMVLQVNVHRWKFGCEC